MGFPAAILAWESSAPVATAVVRLSDVAPDGTSSQVTAGILNLTHRDSHASPAPLEPGAITSVRIQMRSTAYRFLPGHRIRLSVASSYWPVIWPSPFSAEYGLHLGGDADSRLVLPTIGDGSLPVPPFKTTPAGQRTIGSSTDEPPTWRVIDDVIAGTVTVTSSEFGEVVLPDGTSSLYTGERLEMTASDAEPAYARLHNEVVYRVRDHGSEILIEASGTMRSTEIGLPHERRAPGDARRRALLRARLARNDPAPARVNRRDQPTEAGARTATAALAAIGWLLLFVSLPIAIFLTWWGDCFEDACPSASDLDRAVYLVDFVAWLVIPALAFGAYRGWRFAAGGLVGIGIALVAQVVAAILGARGFQSFAFVLPAAALIATAGVIGLRPLAGGDAAGPSARTSLIGLVVVAVVIVAIAFQGVLAGGAGVGQGILVLVAVSLAFIAVLAFLNRSRRPAAVRSAATRLRRSARGYTLAHAPDQPQGRVVHGIRHPRDEPPRRRGRRRQPRPGLSRLPGSRRAEGRGRRRPPRRHQPVRDHMGFAAAPRRDRGEDRSIPSGLGSRPRNADHGHLRRHRGDDRFDARASRPGRRGDRLRAVLRELRTRTRSCRAPCRAT